MHFDEYYILWCETRIALAAFSLTHSAFSLTQRWLHCYACCQDEFVTCGGVDLDMVCTKTLGSKIHPGVRKLLLNVLNVCPIN
jgi:hypothetical protein